MKKSVIPVILALGANNIYSSLTTPYIGNISKHKCLRPECNGIALGNKGYCCAICCHLDKERVKSLNKK